MTIRRKLKCQHCPAYIDALAPFDKFTEATPEACDFSDYDVTTTEECSNCHNITIYYWHDRGLERKHIEEVKDLLFYKTHYLSDYYVTSMVDIGIYDELLGSLAEGTDSLKEKEQICYLMLLREFLWEFQSMRMNRMFSGDEQEKYRKETIDYAKSMAEEFTKFLATKNIDSKVREELEGFEKWKKDHGERKHNEISA